MSMPPVAVESSTPVRTATVWLVPVSGPPLRPIELKAEGGALTVGRQEGCDIRLQNDAVSRVHARLRCERDGWRLADLGSRWGTFLNGCPVQSDADLPLENGDLIRISPWTFNFSSGLGARRTTHAIDDVEKLHTLVRSNLVERSSPGGMAEDRLALLLEAAASLHAATDEPSLAEALLEAACRGSNLPNAAVVRPIDDAGQIAVLAARPAGTTNPSCSRSLLAAASTGQVSEFSPSHSGDGSQSIISMKVDAAMCVPLMLGPTVAAYLYLDARGGGGDAVSPRSWHAAVSFCLALGRIASLALANLKRIDMERRSALIEMELRAAAQAQRWILPRREATVGPLRCFGESRPGRYVGGDFFDILALPDGRIALALGDVAGKAIPASILMTAAHGFLNAALTAGADLASAVAQLNHFIAPRRPDDRFVTLWAGVIDPSQGMLHYIDAGHGYALLSDSADGAAVGTSSRMLDGGDNLPLGVSEDFVYTTETVALPERGQLLLVSDGIIEQPAAPAAVPPATDAAQRPCDFGIAGLRGVVTAMLNSSDPLNLLFETLVRHAGSTALSDDATALIGRW